ncbi:unnamed protein product [Amoebophrya sp. A25]|nr:unnamed protein product [Amoebophrya sp. A25]|eukprot:GSA25T00004531001.1
MASAAGAGAGEPEQEFDPSKVAVSRPLWELHKKGEIMPANDFIKKYYNFSSKHMRDSYPAAVVGKIKYYKKLEEIRAAEPQDDRPISDDGKAWSDTSSHQSMFIGTDVKRWRGVKLPPATSKLGESAAVSEIFDRLGTLIETQMVQDACTHKPQPGTKYKAMGGGNSGDTYFKRLYSREDPWNFPQPARNANK